MASKKTKLTGKPMKLEPLDLGNLDDFLDDNPNPEMKKGGAMRDLRLGFKKGFLEQTKTKAIMRSFLRTSLPDGYSRLFGVFDDAHRMGSSIYDDVKNTNAHDFDMIAAKAESLLPKLKGKLSDKNYQKLAESIANKREDFQYIAKQPKDAAGRERLAKQMQQRQDEMQIQTELFAQSEESSDARFQAERAERGIRDKVSAGRFNSIAQNMGIITDALSSQKAYQDQIGYSLQRKGVELQFRSYFALRNLVKFAEASLETNKTAYEALVRNTGLPDHKKETLAERVNFTGKKQLTRMAMDKLPDFMANFMPQIQANLTGLAQQGMGTLGMMMGAGDGMDLSQLKNNKAGMVGNLAGSWLAGQAKNKLLPIIAKKARPGMEKLSNKYLGGGHDLASYFMNNASSSLQDFTNDYENSSGGKGVLQDILRMIVPQYSLNNQLKDGGYHTIDKQAAFNQLTQRSITEIIPGYLSRILQETRMIRTGRDDIERETFDITKGTFSGMGSALKAQAGRIVTTQQRAGVSGAITDALGKFGAGNLSPEAQEALSARLLKDAATNGRFDPGSYANASGYDQKTDSKTTDELRKFFAAKFDLDENGKTIRNVKNNALLNEHSDALLNIRAVTGDPRDEIKRLFGSGNQEMLRELGLVINEHGMDKINYDKVWEMYRSEVKPGEKFDPDEKPLGGGPPPPAPDSNTMKLVRAKIAQAEAAAKKGYGNLKDQAGKRGWKAPDMSGLGAKVKGILPAFNSDAVMERIRTIKMPDVDRTKLMTMIAGLQMPNMPPVNRQMLTQMLSSVKMPKLDRDAILAMLPSPVKGKLQFAGASAQGYLAQGRALALPHLQGVQGMLPKGMPGLPSLPGFNLPSFNMGGMPALPGSAGVGQHLESLKDKMSKYDLDFIRDTASKLPKIDKKELAVYGAMGKEKGTEVVQKLLAAGETGLAAIKGMVASGLVTGELMYLVATDPELSRFSDVTSSAIRLGASLRDQAKGMLGADPVGLVQQKLSQGKDLVVAGAKGAAEQAQDLYVKGTNELAIRAADIEAGNLIDVNTKKVIQKASDITGTVVDTAGNIKVSAKQISSGLANLKGEVMAMIPFSKAMAWAGNKYAGAAGGYWSWLASKFNGPQSLMGGRGENQDLYLPGRAEPILLARDLDAGVYINQDNQQPIESLDDITGPVVDSTGNVILTGEDFKKGVYTASGEKVKFSRLKTLWGVVKAGLSPATMMIKAQLWVAKKLTSMVIKSIFVLDAYLPGVKQPLLRSSVLKAGGYFYENGKAIRSFDDLRDGVYDEQGNELVSADEIPHLVNRDGSKHTAAKKRSFVRKWAKKILTAPFKAIGRGYVKATKGYYNWLGKTFNKVRKGKTGGGSADLAALVAARNKKGAPPETATEALLTNIAQTLDRRLAPEAAKDGSWQENLAKREAEEKAKKDAKGKKEPKGRKDKKGMSLLEKLAAKFAAPKAAEEEEKNPLKDLMEGAGEGGGDDDKEEKKMSKKDKARARLKRMKERKYGKGRKLALRAARAGGRMLGGSGARALAMNGARMAGTALLGGEAMAGLSGAGALLSSVGGVGGIAASAGSALATGATAIAGVLSAPVVLGVLAVAALGAGAYWLYSRERDSSGDFREFRLDQYGIGNDSTSRALKILNLEGAMEESASKGLEPQLNINSENAEKLLDIVGLDLKDPVKLAEFSKWADLRFKPVFFMYLKAMQTMGVNCKVNELDDKLTPEQKAGFLELVKGSNAADTPYAFTASPFADGDPLEVLGDKVMAHYEELKAKFAKDAPKKDEKDKDGKTPAEIAKAAIPGAPEVVAAVGATGVLTEAAKAAGTPTGNVVPITGVTKGPEMGKLTFVAGAASVTQFGAKDVSALQAIRMRAYGLFGLSLSKVQSVLSIEEIVFAGVQTSTGGLSEFTGDSTTFIMDAASALGYDVTNPASEDSIAFINWIQYRFMPIILTYCSAVKSVDKSIQMARVEQGLSAVGKVTAANAVMAATVERNDEKVSAWSTPSILLPTAAESVLRNLAKADLKVLQDEADKEKLNSPTQSGAAQSAAEAGGAKGMASGAEAQAEKYVGAKETMFSAAKDFVAGVGDSVSSAVDSVKSYLGFGDKTAAPSTPGGTLNASGNVTELAKGNGGSWEQVPMPTAKTREGSMPSFLKIQDLSGINADILATFASIESNFDWTIKAPTSSATGWFQFINDTWDWVLEKKGSLYGIPADDGNRSLRKDPRINGLMGAEYIKMSYVTLSKGLGRPPTDTDLYMAHFLGPGTALKFLLMDKNTDAVNAFPAQAGANKSIFFKKGGGHNTTGEVYAIMDSKVAKHRKGGAGTSVTAQTTPGAGDPVAMAEAQAKATAAGAATGIQQADGPPAANDPSSGTNVSQTAAASANAPLTQVVAGTPGTGTPAAGTGPATPGTGGDPALEAAAAAQLQQAQAQDKARAEQVNGQQTASKAAGDLQAQQLAELQTMSGYLKIIAERMGITPQMGSAAGAQPASNGIDNSAAPRTERSVGQAPAPLRMTR